MARWMKLERVWACCSLKSHPECKLAPKEIVEANGINRKLVDLDFLPTCNPFQVMCNCLGCRQNLNCGGLWHSLDVIKARNRLFRMMGMTNNLRLAISFVLSVSMSIQWLKICLLNPNFTHFIGCIDHEDFYACFRIVRGNFCPRIYVPQFYSQIFHSDHYLASHDQMYVSSIIILCTHSSIVLLLIWRPLSWFKVFVF